MVLHTSERELFICGPGPAFISLKALISNPSMKDFLVEIAKNVLDLVSMIMKSFFFLRIFETLSYIVTMIGNVIVDLRIFLIFYFLLFVLNLSLIYCHFDSLGNQPNCKASL